MTIAHAHPRIALRPAGAPASAAVARRVAVALAVATVIASPLCAQQAAPETQGSWIRPVARYGKWLTAATAIVFTSIAVRQHSHSAESWDQLMMICRTDNADCTVGADGRYLNTIAENYYQRSLYFDARARRRLLVAQAAVVVAASLFIADLTRGPNGPPNIPFDPNRMVVGPASGGGTKIGWRLEF
jgi:hypothetical protein